MVLAWRLLFRLQHACVWGRFWACTAKGLGTVVATKLSRFRFPAHNGYSLELEVNPTTLMKYSLPFALFCVLSVLLALLCVRFMFRFFLVLGVNAFAPNVMQL